MVIRVFRCRFCGHRMRLSGARCGKCHDPKLPWQRAGPFLVLLALAILAGGAILTF